LGLEHRKPWPIMKHGPARPGGLVSGFGSQSRVAAHMPPGGQGLWLGMATGKQPR